MKAISTIAFTQKNPPLDFNKSDYETKTFYRYAQRCDHSYNTFFDILLQSMGKPDGLGLSSASRDIWGTLGAKKSDLS